MKRKKRLLGKKGQIPLMILAEVAVAAMVIFMVVIYAKSAADSERVKKLTLAEDVRMGVEMLAGLSGEAMIKYPAEVSDYKIILSSGMVVVFGEEGVEKVGLGFSMPEGYVVQGNSEYRDWLFLKKEGKEIKLWGEGGTGGE